jgi:hypothetical protein
MLPPELSGDRCAEVAGEDMAQDAVVSPILPPPPEAAAASGDGRELKKPASATLRATISATGPTLSASLSLGALDLPSRFEPFVPHRHS